MQWLQCIYNLWYLWIFESQAHNHKIEFRGPPHLHKPSVFHRFLNNDRISRFYLYVRPSRNSYCLMSTRAASTCCLCVCLCHQWHANCENPPHFTALFSFAFSLSLSHTLAAVNKRRVFQVNNVAHAAAKPKMRTTLIPGKLWHWKRARAARRSVKVCGGVSGG